MHPLILGAGVGALLMSVDPARAACPAPQAAVQESFIAAACADCWSAPSTAPAAPGWRFDWIIPAGPDAPLAAAALPEATERAQRAGVTVPPAGEVRADPRPRPHAPGAAPKRAGPVLKVVSGPAWQGYFGVQLSLQTSARTPLPPGSSAWVALVELLPAGSEGSLVERALLRSVAGPMPPPAGAAGQPGSALHALRWPEGAQPERLQARAWIEGPDGRMLAVAADRCP